MSVLANGVTEHDERKSATNGKKSKLRGVKRGSDAGKECRRDGGRGGGVRL